MDLTHILERLRHMSRTGAIPRWNVDTNAASVALSMKKEASERMSRKEWELFSCMIPAVLSHVHCVVQNPFNHYMSGVPADPADSLYKGNTWPDLDLPVKVDDFLSTDTFLLHWRREQFIQIRQAGTLDLLWSGYGHKEIVLAVCNAIHPYQTILLEN